MVFVWDSWDLVYNAYFPLAPGLHRLDPPRSPTSIQKMIVGVKKQNLGEPPAPLPGGGAEGVRLIVDSTTIPNLFYNLQSAPKSTIYNIQAKFG